MNMISKEFRREEYSFLHEHPKMAEAVNLPEDHVIVDRPDWEQARNIVKSTSSHNYTSNTCLEKTRYVSHQNRAKGSTTWIIKAALRNDKIVIVTPTSRTSDFIRMKIQEAIKNSPWWLKVYWYFKGKPNPKVLCLSEMVSETITLDSPIVFDNSMFAFM